MNVLQDFYEKVFPDSAINDLSSDAYQVEVNDLDLTLVDVTFDLSKSHVKVPKSISERYDFMPLLRTNQPLDRPRTQRQALLTLQKRNMNTPDNNLPVDINALKERSLNRFVSTFCVPGAKEIIEGYRQETLAPSKEALRSWVADLAMEKVSRFTEASEYPDVEKFCDYEMMIKKEPKNGLDKNSPYDYAALQNILCHKKEINALFSPIFRKLFERFQKLLKPSVYCHLRKDLSALDRHLNANVVIGKKYSLLEIDQEKFDKSQTEVCLQLEIFFLECLGLDSELRGFWEYAHAKTTAVNFMNGIKVFLAYQRKTGDAFTCFGNTLISMIAMSSSFDMEDNDASYFVGDDSFIFMNREIELGKGVEKMATAFNLFGKVILSDHGFFCSYFFCNNGLEWRALPDVLKRTERLSKPINSDSLEERFESLKDLCKNLDDYSFYEELSKNMQIRYNTNESGLRAIEALYAVSHDFKRFGELYKKTPMGHFDRLRKFFN